MAKESETHKRLRKKLESKNSKPVVKSNSDAQKILVMSQRNNEECARLRFVSKNEEAFLIGQKALVNFRKAYNVKESEKIPNTENDELLSCIYANLGMAKLNISPEIALINFNLAHEYGPNDLDIIQKQWLI